ncbi:MAG: hypothetical protein NXI04_26475 [Planctomycetaceae bacterium]|nr:hypothetical protein [Planctomycetaceae bacterium]
MIFHSLVSSETPDGNPDYLFSNESGSGEFVIIEEEMWYLNEVCFRCDQAIVSKWNEAADRLDSWKFGDGFTEKMCLEDDVRYWGDMQEVIVAGMILQLLFAFTEKSLKWLCERLGPNEIAVDRLSPRGPKIEGLLFVLREHCNVDFRVEPSFEEAKRVARPLRNKFAHGDWEAFAVEAGDIDLARVFGAISNLFRAIESA